LKSSPHCKPVNHLFVILIDFEALGISRGDLIQSLKDDKIGTQVHYVPVLYQPYYQALYPNHPDLPGVRRYYDQCLSLPLYPTLEMSDVDRVVQSLKNKLEIQ
jgi:dTDP-4-amino-4,6-dideoxygalactose transaminase